MDYGHFVGDEHPAVTETKYAVKRVAKAPVASGKYRVSYTAAANKSAADWNVESEKRHGFSAKTIEVSEQEWQEILAGSWNGVQESREA